MAMSRKITLNKTHAQMQSLITANKLDTQTCYKIIDRGDRGMVFRAATTNQLEFDGIRYMLCPATYAAETDAYSNVWIGVWNAAKQATAAENNLTIWNGLVWKAGAVLAGTAPDAEASGWVVVPKASFTNHEYVEMIFGVSYDFEEDWINKQWDTSGNTFGASKILVQEMEISNLIDCCDWNFKTSGGLFFNNKGFAYYNNNTNAIWGNDVFVISGNNGDSIISNVLKNVNLIQDNAVTEIIGNNNNGGITGNTVNTISMNSNSGDISDNTKLPETTCNIIKNGPSTGTITGVWDADVTDAVVDKTGSAS